MSATDSSQILVHNICTNSYLSKNIDLHKQSPRVKNDLLFNVNIECFKRWIDKYHLSSCFTSPMAQTATETSMSSASSIIRLENLSVNRLRVGTLSSAS